MDAYDFLAAGLLDMSGKCAATKATLASNTQRCPAEVERISKLLSALLSMSANIKRVTRDAFCDLPALGMFDMSGKCATMKASLISNSKRYPAEVDANRRAAVCPVLHVDEHTEGHRVGDVVG
ncbi:unnamed protein product [Ectocarpus sp. CCAP 1310/34]|nr:unnamed protein product [Ectocarpus sp. CCAP 1310/34]